MNLLLIAMADRTEGYQRRLPTVLLWWALLLGTQVFKAQAYENNYSTIITVDKITKEVNNQEVKSLNISCYFDDRIPSIFSLEINRRIPDGRVHYLVEARLDDRNNGEAKKMYKLDSEEGPEFTVMQGSAQQLWLNLLLTNVTAADAGEYVCSVGFTIRSRTDYHSKSAVFSFNEEKDKLMLAASRQQESDDDGEKKEDDNILNRIERIPGIRYAVYAFLGCVILFIIVVYAWDNKSRLCGPSSANAALVEATAGGGGVATATPATPVAGPSGVAASPKPGPSGAYCSKSWPSPAPIAAESFSSLSTLGFETGMEMKTLPVEQPRACEKDFSSTQL